MKKVLFIDRDGTLVLEPPVDYQLDSFEKLEFYPNVFQYLGKIAKELDFELVMVTNQDGLGTDSFPEDTFWPVHNLMLKAFENEGVKFSKQHIDRTFAKDNAPTRKPNTGLLTQYFSEEYDLENSFVIGDRLTDMELAKNLGGKGILINKTEVGADEISENQTVLNNIIAFETKDWKAIYEFLKIKDRTANIERNTNETQINIQLNLDGTGQSNIDTGIAFFDHMLDQLARHGHMDLNIKVNGDLEVDEHHTIEDIAIALGEVFAKALGIKLGIERYGFCLPMDDCLAQAAIDFGGRNWLVWDADFNREMIGKMPTEMFFHFFKSFTDGAKCNLNIKSIQFAFQRLGIEAVLTNNPEAIKSADKVIFPGVGEASSAMTKLKESGLDQLIPQLKQPVLGICLGMQLMCQHTEEGDTQGLGIFNVNVKRFSNQVKVPQMGWNTISDLKSPLFKGVKENEYLYLVHSYYAENCEETIANTYYELNYASALTKDNFFGVQFHPEKSGSQGQKILENFMSL